MTALTLLACDAGNTIWAHPAERPRPKQLSTPSQFREHNVWMMLERGLSLWTETGSTVAVEAWPTKIPESGGILIYEGRLKDLANIVKKEIPISAVIGSVPRPNQAFWTLSALWAGWLWGKDAVEPYKVSLRRRRYDWASNATALHSAFSHLGSRPLGRRDQTPNGHFFRVGDSLKTEIGPLNETGRSDREQTLPASGFRFRPETVVEPSDFLTKPNPFKPANAPRGNSSCR